MKSESRRERAEFAAQLRVHSPKDPPILSTEAIDDLCATFHDDSKDRRNLIAALKMAESTRSTSARLGFIRTALGILEDMK